MPYSLSIFDDVAVDLIKHVEVTTCLDIGAGAGKFGRLVRQLHPRARIVGIEVDVDYVQEFGLSEIYDDIRCLPADRLIEEATDEIYDLVVLGDCLEHMRKSQGVDLLSFLIYRCKYMLIIYPVGLPQGPWHGHLHEAHLSAWSPHDFDGFDHVLLRRLNTECVAINAYLLRRMDLGVAEVLASYS